MARVATNQKQRRKNHGRGNQRELGRTKSKWSEVRLWTSSVDNKNMFCQGTPKILHPMRGK